MNLREKIEYLPHDPGVYRYLDSGGKVIYVGKAKDLKRRVSQYFRPPEQLDRKTRALVERIADLHYTVVETEEDALLLENNLIKQLQPHYNILLKDDKTYPWICIRNEPFPRVMLTRRYVQDGSLYYGPYASVQHARRLLDLMGSLYKLRICAHPLTPEQIASGKVRCCLNYHLEKCAGPCEGLFSQEEYDAQITEIKALLSGRTRLLVGECRAKMQDAAADLRFEEAQEWKERLALLEAHHEREKVVGHGILDMETYKLLKEKTLPRRIEKSEKVVAQLQKDLGMSVPPRHIECFDNSNIQGAEAVAGCVVFKRAKPAKSEYRKYIIKTVEGPDDYASMAEVVYRRYKRLMDEAGELPSLIIADGGKGQMGIIKHVVEDELQLQIPIAGLAKDGKHRTSELLTYQDGQIVTVGVEMKSALFQFLTRIQDEVHRYAIQFHRDKRSKAQVASELDQIKGVGTATKTALLKHFKSVKRIREASEEAIAEVVGKAKAKIIKEAL